MTVEKGATATVHTLKLTPKLLKKIPLEERVCFLTLGHMANELNILRKLVLINSGAHVSNKIERDGQATQSLLLIKLFALKSCAGYEFVRKQTKQPCMKKYVRDPDSDLNSNIRNLNRYFGGKNLLQYMRNKFTAHYDSDEIKGLAKDLSSQTYPLYLTEQQGNSLYFAAEELMFKALEAQAADGEEVNNVMGRLIDDVNEVAALLVDFSQGVMIVIGKRYAQSAWKPANTTSEQIALVDAKNVTLPYFINFESLLGK